MARPDRSSHRDKWWEERLKGAQTPKAKVTVLQGKLLADLSRLPEQFQDEARDLTALLLEGVLDELAIKTIELEWSA